jgi:hypothetical protein
MAVFKGFAGNRIVDGFLLVAQWQFYREFAIVCGIDGVVSICIPVVRYLVFVSICIPSLQSPDEPMNERLDDLAQAMVWVKHELVSIIKGDHSNTGLINMNQKSFL